VWHRVVLGCLNFGWSIDKLYCCWRPHHHCSSRNHRRKWLYTSHLRQRLLLRRLRNSLCNCSSATVCYILLTSNMLFLNRTYTVIFQSSLYRLSATL
jgi:hypothetical protein